MKSVLQMMSTGLLVDAVIICSTRIMEELTRHLFENAYSDSKSLPRGGLSSSTLPSPRKISSVVHRGEEPVGDSTVTVMLMQFGQFLDHDITLTPEQGKN